MGDELLKGEGMTGRKSNMRKSLGEHNLWWV